MSVSASAPVLSRLPEAPVTPPDPHTTTNTHSMAAAGGAAPEAGPPLMAVVDLPAFLDGASEEPVCLLKRALEARGWAEPLSKPPPIDARRGAGAPQSTAKHVARVYRLIPVGIDMDRPDVELRPQRCTHHGSTHCTGPGGAAAPSVT